MTQKTEDGMVVLHNFANFANGASDADGAESSLGTFFQTGDREDGAPDKMFLSKMEVKTVINPIRTGSETHYAGLLVCVMYRGAYSASEVTTLLATTHGQHNWVQKRRILMKIPFICAQKADGVPRAWLVAERTKRFKKPVPINFIDGDQISWTIVNASGAASDTDNINVMIDQTLFGGGQ